VRLSTLKLKGTKSYSIKIKLTFRWLKFHAV
jgi:hypothetical protein